MSDDKMIWLDLETTGLDPINGCILEVGLVVTDTDLRVLDKKAWLVDPGEKAWTLRKMVDDVVEMHTKNGLLEALNTRNEGQPAWEVELEAVQWMTERDVLKQPMCGNTVSFDRSFLAANMRTLLDAFAYRSIDVSSIKELRKRWGFCDEYIAFGDKSHRALDDLGNSIAELDHYRRNAFKAVMA